MINLIAGFIADRRLKCFRGDSFESIRSSGSEQSEKEEIGNERRLLSGLPRSFLRVSRSFLRVS